MQTYILLGLPGQERRVRDPEDAMQVWGRISLCPTGLM